MSDTTERAAPPSTRGVGILAIATGIAAFALLANHPGGEAHDFAGVLREEAANRVTDAAVHGGFIAVLALQTVCYAIFSARIGFSRATATAGLIFFAFGVAFLGTSMVLDGLVTPAVAAKYLAAPDKIEFAKSLFVLIGTLIGFLMPIGLAFQSAAIACWGWALLASRISRAAGVFGLGLGAIALAALASSLAAMNPIVLMGAIAATSVWAVVAGIVLLRR
jgi:hypothetical protein